MKLKNPLNPSLSVVSNTQHLEIDSRIDSDSSVKFLDAVLPRRFQIATTKNTQYSLFYLRYIYIGARLSRYAPSNATRIEFHRFTSTIYSAFGRAHILVMQNGRCRNDDN